MTFRSRNPKRIPAVAFSRVDLPASLRPTIRLSREGSSFTESPWLNWPNPSSLICSSLMSRPLRRRDLALLPGGPDPGGRTVRDREDRHRRRRRRLGLLARGRRHGGVLVQELLESHRERALRDRDLAVDVAVGVRGPGLVAELLDAVAHAAHEESPDRVLGRDAAEERALLERRAVDELQRGEPLF